MTDLKGAGRLEQIRPLQGMNVHRDDLEKYCRLAMESGATDARI